MWLKRQLQYGNVGMRIDITQWYPGAVIDPPTGIGLGGQSRFAQQGGDLFG